MRSKCARQRSSHLALLPPECTHPADRGRSERVGLPNVRGRAKCAHDASVARRRRQGQHLRVPANELPLRNTQHASKHDVELHLLHVITNVLLGDGWQMALAHADALSRPAHRQSRRALALAPSAFAVAVGVALALG
eukprot:3032561-Prymnesium_polylepis.2